MSTYLVKMRGVKSAYDKIVEADKYRIRNGVLVLQTQEVTHPEMPANTATPVFEAQKDSWISIEEVDGVAGHAMEDVLEELDTGEE
jgi:hypothetical protein